MREIKFRAKIVKTGEWVYFDLRDLWHNAIEASFIWDSVCQYTGFKDKNGKEIYSDDLIKSYRSVVYKRYVDYRDGCFWLEDEPLYTFDSSQLEIIGNKNL